MEVQRSGGYGIEKDQYNHVEFEPVSTTALRLEIRLPDGFSTGIQEWVVK